MQGNAPGPGSRFAWRAGGFLCNLTFDMRGGRQQAKPDVGRPLDGRVRGIHSERSIHCELMYFPFLRAYSLNTPTLAYPNFSCSLTEASFGRAMPTTAL